MWCSFLFFSPLFGKDVRFDSTCLGWFNLPVSIHPDACPGDTVDGRNPKQPPGMDKALENNCTYT